MKKVITSLLLLAALLFNIISFTACSGKDKNDEKDDTPHPVPEFNFDLDTMLEGKYADYEISREKLEYALSEALDKIDYSLTTLG